MNIFLLNLRSYYFLIYLDHLDIENACYFSADPVRDQYITRSILQLLQIYGKNEYRPRTFEFNDYTSSQRSFNIYRDRVASERHC